MPTQCIDCARTFKDRDFDEHGPVCDTNLSPADLFAAGWRPSVSWKWYQKQTRLNGIMRYQGEELSA